MSHLARRCSLQVEQSQFFWGFVFVFHRIRGEFHSKALWGSEAVFSKPQVVTRGVLSLSLFVSLWLCLCPWMAAPLCPCHSFPPSGSQGGKASSGCHSGPFVGSPGLSVSQPPPPSLRPSVALEAASKAGCEVCFDTHKRAASGSTKRPGMVSPSRRGGSKEKTNQLHLPVPRGGGKLGEQKGVRARSTRHSGPAR